MDTGTWITLLIGVLAAVIAGYSAWIARDARTQSERSADTAAESLAVSRAMRALSAESVRIQSEAHDAVERPDFLLIRPKEADPERDLHGVVTHLNWVLRLQLIQAPTRVRLWWSAVFQIEGCPEAVPELPEIGAVEAINYSETGMLGPLQANIGNEFAVDARHPIALAPIAKITCTVTVWSEEVDHETWEPTGRTWPPWVRTLRFGPEIDITGHALG